MEIWIVSLKMGGPSPNRVWAIAASEKLAKEYIDGAAYPESLTYHQVPPRHWKEVGVWRP